MEADELVRLQVLEVAHSKQLLLILELGKVFLDFFTRFALRNGGNQTVFLLAFLAVLDLVLEPSESKVKANMRLIVTIELIADVVIGQVPVSSVMALSHISVNRISFEVVHESLIQG